MDQSIDAEQALLERHRAEKKDLQNQITGMKKQATKSKRKQVNARCEELEHQMQLRHKQELEELTQGAGAGAEAKAPEETHSQNPQDGEEAQEVSPEKLLEQLSMDGQDAANAATTNATQQQQQQQQPKKRRNRQREKIAKREAEVARMKQAAALEAAQMPDYKQMEQDALDQICTLNKLIQHDIQPDGHCLFASILDQLQTRHLPLEGCVYEFPKSYSHTNASHHLDVYKLRSLATCYVREHPDDFVPYLFDEATLTVKDIADYTKTMEETAQWGGEVEILALAKVLKCCISVLMSGRATHLVNEDEMTNPQLKLVYYKHSYALGEHYNSLRDE
ncbi:LAME_0G14928g1_1 [Lachancea meyersii CBS 8951]|uniref:LAME_0G14928g1_1 n=1 Tax=Lachancea meyersii CBS 8951 TaxID=1266667 RepID=A0A1G4KAK1_9SACH|nr:LAME_0G14928g1_1 [Lachancea meyersii CBS 8951]